MLLNLFYLLAPTLSRLFQLSPKQRFFIDLPIILLLYKKKEFKNVVTCLCIAVLFTPEFLGAICEIRSV